METDALADVLKQIDKEKRKLLIQLLDEQVRKDIEMIAPLMRMRSEAE